MSDKSTALSQSPRRSTRPSRPERDTLQSFDQIFLHDQLEALLASPTLARVAARNSVGSDDPADFEDIESERDTEPGVDAQLLRDALRRGLK